MSSIRNSPDHCARLEAGIEAANQLVDQLQDRVAAASDPENGKSSDQAMKDLGLKVVRLVETASEVDEIREAGGVDQERFGAGSTENPRQR